MQQSFIKEGKKRKKKREKEVRRNRKNKPWLIATRVYLPVIDEVKRKKMKSEDLD